MRSRRAIKWAVVVVFLCAVVGVVTAVRRAAPAAANSEVPTVLVQRGDLDMKVSVTGELRASHAEVLSAPAIGGGALQLTHLLHTGAAVDVGAAQDKVALLKARFDVRRAELEVQKNELVGAIDARKNQLALEGARRVLAELEQDLKSRSASYQATIELAQEKRNKARLAMDQAEDSIRKMRVTAPMEGLVALEKNEGDDFFGGMVPEYREGDHVNAGQSVLQVIDPRGMELIAKVGELERNTVKEGQSVDLQLDALPGSIFHGTVKAVGGNNARAFWEPEAAGKFEVTILLASPDPGMRPGLTGRVFINSEPRKSVLYVPRQAVFVRDGKRVVYVRNGSTK